MSLRTVRSRAAFTLIELLVVIGIIAVMAGVIGVALRGGGDSASALQGAQGTVSSLLSAARGQAALSGRNAALMVYSSNTDANTYMRVCAVAVRNTANTEWLLTGNLVYLPNGVYILPPTSPSGSMLDDGVAFGGIASTAFSTTTETIVGQTGNWHAVQYDSLGKLSPATGGFIVLSVASPQPPGSTPVIKFTNSNNVRGLSVSKCGVAALLNERKSFN